MSTTAVIIDSIVPTAHLNASPTALTIFNPQRIQPDQDKTKSPHLSYDENFEGNHTIMEHILR